MTARRTATEAGHARLVQGGQLHAEAVMRKQVAAIVAGVLILVILGPAIYTILELRT